MNSYSVDDLILMSWNKTPRAYRRDDAFILQRLSVRCILKHFKRFLTQAKVTNSNPFEKLSNTMRNLILALIDKADASIYREDRTQMLQLLINSSTSELELRFDPDEGKKFLANLVALRPKLKRLELKVYFPEEDEMECDELFEIPIPDHFFRAILNFVELEDLDLNKAGCLSDVHLGMIAASLKNLKILQLNLDFGKVTMAGLKKLSGLKDMRKIRISGNTLFESAHIKMCHNLLRVLPQLESFNYYDQSIRCTNSHNDLNAKSLNFSLLPKTPIQLGLKQMILCNTAAQIPPNVTMTSLESLYLIKTHAFAPSTNLNKVSTLCLSFLGINACYEILGHLGHQLHTLNIIEKRGTLYLDNIAQKCPKLEEFYLPDGPPELATNFGEMSFPHLKIFTYNECHESTTIMAKFGPSMLLHLLSGAPNLTIFGFKQVELSQMEVDEVISELRKGTLLQKLERFRFNILKKGGNETQRNFKQMIVNRCKMLGEEMKLHCPCLKDITATCF